MRVSLSLYVDDLNRPQLTATPANEEGRRQVACAINGKIDAFAYVTAADARQIADAWSAIGDQIDFDAADLAVKALT